MECCCNKHLKLQKWLGGWVTGRGWKSSEALNRKRLDCLEKIVGRNRNVKGDSGEGSEKERKAVENICIVLENTCISRMLLEI